MKEKCHRLGCKHVAVCRVHFILKLLSFLRISVVNFRVSFMFKTKLSHGYTRVHHWLCNLQLPACGSEVTFDSVMCRIMRCYRRHVGPLIICILFGKSGFILDILHSFCCSLICYSWTLRDYCIPCGGHVGCWDCRNQFIVYTLSIGESACAFANNI